MTKVFGNTFRAVNVEAAATKPFGIMKFSSGPGVGGRCIPTDPFYLTWKAREYDFHTRFIELAGETNAQMPSFVREKVIHEGDHTRPLVRPVSRLGPLVALAQERRIAIVEDCAQSIGSTWSPAAGGAPRKTGTLGTIGCFSFFPTKDLGAAGDGGMCATDDPALAERACREALSLPMFPELTEPEQDSVVETLKQVVAQPAGAVR